MAKNVLCFQEKCNMIIQEIFKFKTILLYFQE